MSQKCPPGSRSSETSPASGSNLEPSDAWRRRILDLKPRLTRAGSILALAVLRNDALAAELAGVREDLVASLSRPGGNLTGTTNFAVELGPKRLELLHELVPAATVIALLDNPSNPADLGGAPYQAAARSLGLQLVVLQARSEQDFEAAFASLLQQRVGALLLSPDPYLTSRSDQLVALAVRHAVPAMFTDRQYVAAGGLASYGASVVDAAHLAAIYAGRILKGEKSGGLPIQQSTKVEMAINLKTAKTLGLTVPQSMLFGADEVIE
jgi:putative tryptophan/tyrosine transport system substrate-binding protein